MGAILYELLTGRPPFRGETDSGDVATRGEESPHPPRVHNPRVDRAAGGDLFEVSAESAGGPLPHGGRHWRMTWRASSRRTGSGHSGTASAVIVAVMRETRYTEVMQLWSGVWMGLAFNSFFVCLTMGLLLWYDVRDYTPYWVAWIVKMLSDWGMAWFLRIRSGPAPIAVERQLFQIWIFFWANYFLIGWLYAALGRRRLWIYSDHQPANGHGLCRHGGDPRRILLRLRGPLCDHGRAGRVVAWNRPGLWGVRRLALFSLPRLETPATHSRTLIICPR